MNATTRTEVVVTLTLSQREALLLRALMNGMGVDDQGASAAVDAIASALWKPARVGLTLAEVAEFDDFIPALYAALGEVIR